MIMVRGPALPLEDIRQRSSGVGRDSDELNERRLSVELRLKLLVSPGKATETRFKLLAAEWRRSRGAASSVRAMSLHPAYQQIIGMGWDAVPWILRELETEPDHWFWALWAITDHDAVRENHKGRLALMAKDWVEWGRSIGLSW